MQLHLDDIAKNVIKRYHELIVMNKVEWHLASKLNIPKNITLIKLLPYSPEFNPMEQVFQQLRKIKLSNTFYKNYKKLTKPVSKLGIFLLKWMKIAKN